MVLSWLFLALAAWLQAFGSCRASVFYPVEHRVSIIEDAFLLDIYLHMTSYTSLALHTLDGAQRPHELPFVRRLPTFTAFISISG